VKIAFFDLDRTLLHGNSARLWVRHEFRRGALRRRDTLRAFAYLAAYRLGVANFEEAIKASIATLEGTRETDLRARSAGFYHREVKPLVRRDARDAIADHRVRGDRLVLLTSSSPYLAAPVMRELALDDALCTRLEVDDRGCFTGRPEGHLCFGSGKVTLADSYASEYGIALKDCVFYSDSFSDLPMLEAVGEPRVVTPDPRLRRVARARGWPIHDWA
jgi:HAD superfamily hydrolase (TIGR01490 family)